MDQIHEIDYLDCKLVDEKEDTAPEPTQLKQRLGSARESLAIEAAMVYLRDNGPAGEADVTKFLLHTAYLSCLSIYQRRLMPVDAASLSEQEIGFLKSFTEVSTKILRASTLDFDTLSNDLADYVDGNLLFSLRAGTEHPPAVVEKFNTLVGELESEYTTTLFMPDLPPRAGDKSSTGEVEDSELLYKLLPFSHPEFDEFLAKVKLSPDVILPESNDLDEEERQRQAYWEQYFINNPKKQIAPPPKPKVVVQQKVGKGNQAMDRKAKREAGRARKYEQVYSNQMYQYAASLTGSVDGAIDPKLVLVEEAAKKPGQQKKAIPEKKTSGPGKKLPAKGKGGSAVMKADEIRKLNNVKKTDEISKKLTRTWSTVYARPLPNPEEMLQKIDDWMKANKPKGDDEVAMEVWATIEVEARLYKIYLLQRIWISHCIAKTKPAGGYQCVAELFLEARKVLNSPGLSQKALEIVNAVFKGLKIKTPAAPVMASLPKRKLSNAFDKWDGTSVTDTALGMSSEEFQLLHCGPLMDRNMDSKPDPRVAFDPDGWQRDVLDELDRDNSVFVVAPTSAGKTFIAFYAMEKVLKADDEGILIYVAPTKALVNQIAAEVISRFKKNYSNPGKTVWAVHNGDYTVNDPLKCQILVTVPDVLQTLLMSPANAVKWSPRVRRIIFDEVHSLGNADDGVVWEQLLMLAPCPIIALSATVGNPKEFAEWLEATQKGLGKKLVHISHPHRYSDLRKYLHVIQPNERNIPHPTKKVSKYVTLDNNSHAVYIHPLAAVQDTASVLPPDLSFEPKDCLLAYNAMVELATPEFPVPESLDYKKVFGTEGKPIKKEDTIKWEAQLKKHLESWMQNREKSPFMKVVQKLGSVDIPQFKDTLNVEEYLRDTGLALLRSLESTNALPAIVFNYNRTICEKLCDDIVGQLQKEEDHYKETDPSYKRKVKEFEERAKKKIPKTAKKVSQEKGSERVGKEDLARESAESALDAMDTFDPMQPLQQFSFSDQRMHSKNDLDRDCAQLSRWGISEKLVAALRRGVGVHHAGMNRKYRQAVEMLFRKGFLRVIIATGTLALGINMPTRTTVFAGDSIYLTALNYRQAAGRAGRRGFDNLGNVVFHGLSKSQVLRLMSSKLPSLIGHFPISTSLVLRAFILMHNSGESEFARKMVRSIVTQSRMMLGGNAREEQVLHHLRFSIEFLRRNRLLSAEGAPLNFAGMITHLYGSQEAAFALVGLLSSGYLQKICQQVDEKPESTALELMLIMSHFFGVEPSRTKLRLPPLPEECTAILRKQNEEIVELYSTYALNYAEKYEHNPDNTLPFSATKFGGSENAPLPNSLPPVTARSAFVALSGHSDTFNSIPDIATGVRDGIFVEGSSIPILPLSTPDNTPNSYLYDFYKHGDKFRIERENGIRTSDIWFKLKDFSLILTAVEAGLKAFIKDGPGKYYELANADEEDGEIPATTGVPALDEDDDEETLAGEEGKDWGDDTTTGGAPQAMGFEKVWKGFKVLQANFDKQFKAMWA